MAAPLRDLIDLLKASDAFIERRDEDSRRAFYAALERVKQAERTSRSPSPRRTSNRQGTLLLILLSVLIAILLILLLVLLSVREQLSPSVTLARLPSVTVTLTPASTVTPDYSNASDLTLTLGLTTTGSWTDTPITGTETTTATPTQTSTVTSTITATPTATATMTETATPTATATMTETATSIPTATRTFTKTSTATFTATRIPTKTQIPSPTPIPFNVIGVTSSANPSSYNGNCPANVSVAGQIFTQGSGTVTYRWERSDGSAGPSTNVNTASGNPINVSDSRLIGASGVYVDSLHVLAPGNNVGSTKFAVNCTPTATPIPKPAVLAVKLSVAPTDYKGVCPTTFTFTADIIASAPMAITYRWERSDGATGPSQLINSQGGDNYVQTTWTLGGTGFTYSGYNVVHIIAPNDNYGDKNATAFTLVCS